MRVFEACTFVNPRYKLFLSAADTIIKYALSPYFEPRKMEEDVNVKFDGYDEDLNDNPFFKYIQTRHKTLYDDIAKHRWIVSNYH